MQKCAPWPGVCVCSFSHTGSVGALGMHGTLKPCTALEVTRCHCKVAQEAPRFVELMERGTGA